MGIHSWDIFCRVVDNFGDVGVSWRLARQLAAEHAAGVRLWLDDLPSLHAMWPDVDALAARQMVAGVEIRLWNDDCDFSAVPAADVMVEAFGCGLPDAYVRHVAGTSPHTLWVVLEYLSAEAWVAGHHGLPSPHPRFPLRRFFFFPGFAPGTGGVLCESGLIARRDAFDAASRNTFWRSLGLEPPEPKSTVLSLFAYEHAPVEQLLAAWAEAEKPVVAVLPQGRLTERVASYVDLNIQTRPAVTRRGALEVRFIPFLSQPEYDSLLWSCDVNFVRGEDSFVRAQWALRPFVWHAYPQAHDAHQAKLGAFLACYGDCLPPAAAPAVRGLWVGWNGADTPQSAFAGLWQAFQNHFQGQRDGLGNWTQRLVDVGDLAGNLAKFCESRYNL